MNYPGKYILYITSILLLTSSITAAWAKSNKHASKTSADFDKSMGKGTRHYDKKFTYNKPNYKNITILKKLYEQNSFDKTPLQQTPLIPLILHQIWVGGKKLPQKYVALRDTWIKKHPDWKHYLWTDKEVKSLKMRNRKFYDRATDPVEKANILRYELLHKYGGVYADIDFQCLQNFDKFNYRYAFYTGICPADCRALLNNALIGCVPGHPIIKECVENMKNTMHYKTRFHRNGVLYYSNSFLKKLIDSPARIIAFPATYFYPLSRNFKNNDFLERFLKPETHAVHYWAHVHQGVFSIIDTEG
jgi:mannosyltransferase OCH1-like enzyme